MKSGSTVIVWLHKGLVSRVGVSTCMFTRRCVGQEWEVAQGHLCALVLGPWGKGAV